MSDYHYLDQLTDACLVLGHNQEIVYYNHSLLIIGNLKERELKRLTFAELVSFNEWPQNELSVETEFRFFNGTQGFAQIKKIQIDHGRVLVVMNDLTIEKQLHVKFQNQLVELKSLNQNLENLVELRTTQLSRVNKYLSGILTSFKQAIFTVNRSGEIDLDNGLNLEIMGENAPMHLQELFAKEMSSVSLRKWVDFVYAEALPFDEMSMLIPAEIEWNDIPYRVDCYPFTNEKEIQSIIIALTNITNEVKVRDENTNKELLANSLLKASQSGRWYAHVLEECRNILKKVTDSQCEEEAALPLLHALKGLFSYYGPVGLDLGIHQIETSSLSWPLRLEMIKDIEKKFNDISQKVLDLFPHLKSNHQVVAKKDLNLMGSCKDVEDIKKILLPYTSIQLESFCLGVKDYCQEISLSVSKELHHFHVSGESLFLDFKIFGLINQFLIQGVRNSVSHVFSETEDSENKIEINYRSNETCVFLSLKSFGLFPVNDNPMGILSGQKQGMRLIETMASRFNCRLELDIQKEKGYSDFRLLIPRDYIVKA